MGFFSVDAAGGLSGVHQHADFVVVDFSKATHQGDGGPLVAITHAQHPHIEGGEQGDVTGKHTELTGGAGQDDLVSLTIEDVLIGAKHPQS